jgi:hypothetical protein
MKSIEMKDKVILSHSELVSPAKSYPSGQILILVGSNA